MIRAWFNYVLASAILLGAAGCGPKSAVPVMKVFPVSGKLTVDGAPAEGIAVTLSPKARLADSRRTPNGATGADGSFRISTYDVNDGAPAGAYLVVVAAPPQGISEPTRQILKKYIKMTNDGPIPIPVAEVVVKEGDNVLEPINLTGK
jgi:hypothetical protein